MNKTFLLLILLFSLGSCHIFRKAGSDSSDKTIKKVQDENYVPTGFKSFKGKMKIDLNSEAFSGKMMLFLKIRNDSLIWGSVTAVLGFEVARFYITKDSITLLDRLHQKYYRFPFSILADKFGIHDIDYRFVQNFFMGNYLFDLTNKFVRSQDETNLVFYLKDKIMDKTVFVNKKTFRISRYILQNDSLSQHIVVDYLDKIKNKGITIPKQITIEMISPYKLNADMVYSNINFNVPLEFNTDIPQSYEKGN